MAGRGTTQRSHSRRRASELVACSRTRRPPPPLPILRPHDPYLSEFIGTAVLVFLGNAVVANVLLRRTKGRDSGWIVIATGWAMAVFVGVVVAGASGAHLNPAVTIALWADGTFAANLVPGYIIAQMAGAMAGAFLVFLQFLPHWGITEDAGAKLACFSTGPGVRAPLSNMVAEALSTFVFVLAVLMLVDSPWAKSAGIHAPDAPAADPTLLWSMKVADGRWAPMVVAATFWGSAWARAARRASR